MSAESLDFHHGKHHQIYVDKTNELVAGQALEGAALSQVIKSARTSGHQMLFNNSAQVWNHTFFWQGLAPAGATRPSGKLLALIDESFSGVDALLARMQAEAVSHFASGWAWLILENGRLKVTSLHDADTPVAYDGMKPLFTLDAWEHAYYIDHRNARANYAGTVLRSLVNWDFVASNLDGEGLSRADQG